MCSQCYKKYAFFHIGMVHQKPSPLNSNLQSIFLLLQSKLHQKSLLFRRRRKWTRIAAKHVTASSDFLEWNAGAELSSVMLIDYQKIIHVPLTIKLLRDRNWRSRSLKFRMEKYNLSEWLILSNFISEIDKEKWEKGKMMKISKLRT